MIQKFKKKPVVIEAIQWNGENEIEIMDFVGKGRLDVSKYPARHIDDTPATIVIPTPEGKLVASRYDWILKGYSKDLGFHCWVNKPDFFKENYEPSSEDNNTATALSDEDIERMAFEKYPVDETMQVKGNHFRREAFIAVFKAAQHLK